MQPLCEYDKQPWHRKNPDLPTATSAFGIVNNGSNSMLAVSVTKYMNGQSWPDFGSCSVFVSQDFRPPEPLRDVASEVRFFNH